MVNFYGSSRTECIRYAVRFTERKPQACISTMKRILSIVSAAESAAILSSSFRSFANWNSISSRKKKINIDMALSVKEPDSSRSAPAPDTKKQKQEEKAFSVWCELRDLETACINAFDELPENDSGDKMQEDLSMIRKLKGIAENFANYEDESDYNKIVEADTTISKLKRHYKEKRGRFNARKQKLYYRGA